MFDRSGSALQSVVLAWLVGDLVGGAVAGIGRWRDYTTLESISLPVTITLGGALVAFVMMLTNRQLMAKVIAAAAIALPVSLAMETGKLGTFGMTFVTALAAFVFMFRGSSGAGHAPRHADDEDDDDDDGDESGPPGQPPRGAPGQPPAQPSPPAPLAQRRGQASITTVLETGTDLSGDVLLNLARGDTPLTRVAQMTLASRMYRELHSVGIYPPPLSFGPDPSDQGTDDEDEDFSDDEDVPEEPEIKPYRRRPYLIELLSSRRR